MLRASDEEQIRTVSIERFRRPATDIVLSAEQLREVRGALAQMLIV
ncbi:hypothetical protein [Actinocatenispora sera]|uniref:PemK-like, MazF-like toxin of type II toxin-antitoxin system n=1 Tax=Actinocatenispora sera TaxID=390989 RepID=A0A810L8T9_9ACTN|nr:hypothetical protein [Actinocatenispora sera]BCJ31954.1 hypothetical protein Asera_60620 [Actinocatenispora sera]